ncbi:hypothetical protein [Aestuariimicrobium ganziense]|uniref:hypothetical protein n=1 Tax=Aestuariimicrobium ganziense TaxID=2773677 RepID=UPI00194113A3|nr:hypothetical protein [Aestuariimicrobium ganziense]
MDAANLVQLARAHWYDAVESMLRRQIAAGDSSPHLAEACELASIAHRVMSLDAEDFHELARQRKRSWNRALASCAFPHQPREPQRGALGSLVPLYELMLEVVDLRAERGEPQSLVVTAHLLGEYLCQLGWEERLGHGGDPLLMRRTVGQRWGTDDPLCPHSSAMRSTARRSTNAAHGDQPGFTRYLDKFHSRLGDTLAVCAMNHETIGAGQRPDVGLTCPNPCSWVLEGTLDERRDLDARMRLALLYLESPLVALRHHAPVGHFFGVPSVAEISRTWVTTWERLTQQWPDGSNPLVAALAERGESGRRHRAEAADEALPGLSLLVSVIAGQSIGAGRLLEDIGDDLVEALERWQDAS